MAGVLQVRIVLLLTIVALLSSVAVNCRQSDAGYVGQLMMNRSRRSWFSNVFHKIGKPFRLAHSAHLLLLGKPRNKTAGSAVMSQTTIASFVATKSTPSIYTTRSPPPMPATVAPVSAKNVWKPPADSSSSTACTPITPGSDSKLVASNLHRLMMTDCGRLENLILDGEEAMPGEFPWLALVRAESYYYPGEFMFVCGGSLINDRYVLTAAHCVLDGRYEVHSVVFGEYNTETEENKCSSVEALFVSVVNGGFCRPDPPIEMKVECATVHPEFINAMSRPHDIALLRLQRVVEFSVYIHPICLPVGRFDIRIKEDIDLGNRLTVAGWGMTMNESWSSTPMKAEIPMMDFTGCSHLVSNVPSGKLCVGDVVGSTPCFGDSGGSLFIKKMMEELDLTEGSHKRRPKAVQVGIVSVGSRRCDAGQPTLVTNVQHYLLWMLENMKP